MKDRRERKELIDNDAIGHPIVAARVPRRPIEAWHTA